MSWKASFETTTTTAVLWDFSYEELLGAFLKTLTNLALVDAAKHAPDPRQSAD